MTKLTAYFFLFLTIAFTVYGQLVLKWQTAEAGVAPTDLAGKASYVAKMMLKPWVLTGWVAAALAAFAWMLVLSRLSLGQAYPAMALTFPLVLVMEHLLWGEALSLTRVLGITLIFIGVTLAVRAT